MFPGTLTTLVRERPTFVDDGHGNEVADWTAPDSLAIDGWSVQPGLSAIDAINRTGVLISFTAWGPVDADVRALDRIQYRGKPFVIDGFPEVWDLGVLDHTKIFLKRWEG